MRWRRQRGPLARLNAALPDPRARPYNRPMARQPQSQTATLPPEPVTTTAGPAPEETGGTLTIDLGAIAANYKMLAARVLPGDCAGVVKGDAYGCGIDQVTTTLKRAGCHTFFVAHLAEAR